MKFIRVNKKNPCQICGKPDNCAISTDGKFAYCRRVESGSVKQGRDGGFVHVLIEDGEFKPKRKPLPEPKKQIAPKPTSDLHQVYSEFLSHLVLAKNHEENLRNRGTGIVEINLHGYKSMPSPLFASKICANMTRFGYDLAKIPGFYFKNGQFHFEDYYGATGFLIPIRDGEHKICGLTLRRDDNKKPKYLIMSSVNRKGGLGPGVPPHFSFLGFPGTRADIREIIITEGALKANLIYQFTGIPTVGLVSTTCFNDSFTPQLKKVFPNLVESKVAFDMEIFDPNNPTGCAFVHVKRQRERLVNVLSDGGLRSTILTWTNQHKGFDDYLVAINSKNRCAA